MRFRERDQSSIRSYQRISLSKRKRLVELALDEGEPLSKIAKKLKIKLTTARLIIAKYKRTGEFPMRQFRKRALKDQDSLRKQQQLQKSQGEASDQPDAKDGLQQEGEGQIDALAYCPGVLPYYFSFINGYGFFLLPYTPN